MLTKPKPRQFVPVSRRRRPELRLPGAAMTMAVGFTCKDGLVIAADQQFTGDAYTYQGCKLSELPLANGIAIWGYAGRSDIARRFGDELGKIFDPQTERKRQHLQGCLKTALSETLAPETDENKESFYTLFGAWTENEEQCLFRSNGLNVFPVGDCEIIGWGDSPLARYLRGIALRAGVANLNVWQAAVMAIYFVLQGKNYDGQYVGGSTDVFIIDKNHKHRTIPVAQVRMWESALEAVDQHIATLFSAVTNAEHAASTPDVFDFANKILVFGEQVRTLKSVEDAG